jgi:esterase/lipase
LVISAEWDQDTPLFMAQEVFRKLVNTPHKRQVVLAEGTHTIAIEKNRMELIKEVQCFLDEDARLSEKDTT